jgi:PleD family two-component response regulator
MIEYKRINKSESVRGLRLTTDNHGFEHGSEKYAGETLDIVIQDEYNPKLKQRTIHLKRVTFGFHVIDGLVCVMSEILIVKDNEPKEDYIDNMLNQAAYENGWD